MRLYRLHLLGRDLRLAFTHPGRIGQANQNAFRAEQTGHGLTPWLFLCCYQKRVPLCFQLLRGLGNIFDIKFEPGGGSWQMRWPFVHAKTRLCSLRKRPEGKSLDPFELFSVEVATRFFFEREAKALSIESYAFLRISGDWAVTGNKYDFHLKNSWKPAPFDEAESLTAFPSSLFHSSIPLWSSKNEEITRERPASRLVRFLVATISQCQHASHQGRETGTHSLSSVFRTYFDKFTRKPSTGNYNKQSV